MRALLSALCLCSLSGCLNGAIYTHTILPLTTDLGNTPVVEGPGVRSSLTQVRYSYLDLRAGNNALGEIARENGLTRIYYADVEVFRILIWTQTYVRVYGAKTPAAE